MRPELGTVKQVDLCIYAPWAEELDGDNRLLADRQIDESRQSYAANKPQAQSPE
jgi:hypothetical protein